MTISLKQIRYFIAAAEAQQISTAAAELGISQPAITVAIKELEADLGVALIRRRVGGIGLTQEGMKFLSRAKNIEMSVADAILSVRKDDSRIVGKIRLGVTYTGLGYFLLPMLARFMRHFPDISVELHEMSREELESAIVSDCVDLALIIISNIHDYDSISYRILLRSQRLLWMSSRHKLNKISDISLSDLNSEKFVQFTSDEADISASKYLSNNGFAPNIVLKTTSMEAVRGMVATGAAITILANLVYRPWSLDGDRVELRPLRENIPSLDLGLAWHRGRPLSEAESRLLHFLELESASSTP
jgi:DNA-binding transcriptional LysR family regulator